MADGHMLWAEYKDLTREADRLSIVHEEALRIYGRGSHEEELNQRPAHDARMALSEFVFEHGAELADSHDAQLDESDQLAAQRNQLAAERNQLLMQQHQLRASATSC